MAKKADDLELGVPADAAKKKLMIMVAIGVLVLLIGGGVTAWLLLRGDHAGADKGRAQAEHSAPPARAPQGPVTYQELAPVFVANLPGQPSLLQVGLQVRIRYPELGEFLKHNDPALRNAILNLLSSQDGQTLKTREGKEQLRAALRTAINAVIHSYRGPGEIDEIFYSSFVMQ